MPTTKLCCKCKKPLSEKLIKEHRFLCNECYESNLRTDSGSYSFVNYKMYYTLEEGNVLDKLLSLSIPFYT